MKYGLIGEKLSHSFSTHIHHQLFGYEYELKEITLSELPAFLQNRGFCAINVTIPYKETVIPYLDVVDEMAQTIGAVNTVVNRDGKLYGYNTDFDGLLCLLEHNRITVRDKKVLILGSGGTSKTAMAVVRALGCREAYRVSRTERDECITYEQSVREHGDAQVLINTTPCGMYPNGGVSAVDLADYPHLDGVVDVVYNPLRTKLVCDALERGIPAVGGLYMLVAQAARAAEVFVGQSVSRDRVDAIYQNLIAEKENIVLIGMPTSGKTTVGGHVATMLQRDLIDTDARVVQEMGCSVPDLFEQMGENGFRDCEEKAVADVATQQGVVIATGGGVILRPINVQRLRENGRLYFLDRSPDLLMATADRPLFSNHEDLLRRFEERYPLYTAVCDVRIEADGSTEMVAKAIREDFLNEYFGDKRT